MRRIIGSLVVIAGVAALGIFGSQAFFSDTETSTGNKFVAGDIDLKVDNESYVTSTVSGLLVANPATSWSISDLTNQLFFNFSDVKPGDLGEDTISLHVNNNDSWLCAAARVTDDSDVTCTEPELADDLSCTEPGLNGGELDSSLNFGFWADDGDNVLETDEVSKIFVSGPVSGLGASGQIALADSTTNVWTGVPGVIPGGSDRYIGKGWCFGTLTPAAVTQDGQGKTGTNGPLVRGTGFTCNGATANNAAQTDQVMGDLEFYSVQSRNNASFTCASGYTPSWSQNQ